MHFQIGLFLWELQGIRGMFHVRCIRWKIFEQIDHVFLITMLEIDTAADVYLELFQTYTLELFCENS